MVSDNKQGLDECGAPTNSNNNSERMEAGELGEDRNGLLTGAFAKSTMLKYNPHWNEYLNFILDLDLEFSELVLCKYIRFLYGSNYKYNSIASRMAEISHGLQASKEIHNTCAHLPKMMLRGVKKTNKYFRSL